MHIYLNELFLSGLTMVPPKSQRLSNNENPYTRHENLLLSCYLGSSKLFPKHIFYWCYPLLLRRGGSLAPIVEDTVYFRYRAQKPFSWN